MAKGKTRDEAIKGTMEASVREKIMTEFIAKHGSEVRNMLFTEFNLEDAREVWEEEARDEGREEGAVYTLIEETIRKLKKEKSPEVIFKAMKKERGK